MTHETMQLLEPELDIWTQGRDADLAINLPWPPSVNRYWGHRPMPPKTAVIMERIRLKGTEGFYRWLQKNTRVHDHLRPDGEIFREAAAWLFRDTRKRFGSVNCAVWLHYHPPRRGGIDVLNWDKGILDAAEWAGVVDNDRQFKPVLASEGDVVKGGLVEVRIWRLG